MSSMKGRENKGGLGGVPSTDLLVCFPSRAHLTLMPKPICSPARPSEPNKRRHHHHHHLKKINTRGGPPGGGGPASPLVSGPEMSEPTSPKVTCAGQIKVRPRASSTCRNWQSVMEEVERIHNRSKHKKKSNWAGPLGFKKDIMNFLTCLRSIRFDLRCFGSFPEAEATSDDDEDDDDDVDEEDETGDQGSDHGSTVFSKWFMVLQENHQQGINTNYVVKDNNNNNNNNNDDEDRVSLENDENTPVVPPPNALLLMRCRSAPAKSWLEERENRAKQSKEEKTEENEEKENEKKEVREEEEEEDDNEEMMKKKKKKKRRASLEIVMKYDKEFYMEDEDEDEEVAQETWIVGDPFARSRSWKR